jgi:hypothetical protein
MKKIKTNVFVITLLLPFLSVWTAWVMTALNFDVREVFHKEAFWAISGIYWFIWVCVIGMVLDELKVKEPAK